MNCHICICLELYTQHIVEQWRFTLLQVIRSEKRGIETSEAVGRINGSYFDSFVVLQVMFRFVVRREKLCYFEVREYL